MTSSFVGSGPEPGWQGHRLAVVGLVAKQSTLSVICVGRVSHLLTARSDATSAHGLYGSDGCSRPFPPRVAVPDHP